MVHASGVRKNQAMDWLAGDDQNEDVVKGLLYINSSRQQEAVWDTQADSIIQKISVQRLLDKLNSVTWSGPGRQETA